MSTVTASLAPQLNYPANITKLMANLMWNRMVPVGHVCCVSDVIQPSFQPTVSHKKLLKNKTVATPGVEQILKSGSQVNNFVTRKTWISMGCGYSVSCMILLELYLHTFSTAITFCWTPKVYWNLHPFKV